MLDFLLFDNLLLAIFQNIDNLNPTLVFLFMWIIAPLDIEFIKLCGTVYLIVFRIIDTGLYKKFNKDVCQILFLSIPTLLIH